MRALVCTLTAILFLLDSLVMRLTAPLVTNLPKQTGIIQDNNGGNGWGIEVVPEITIPDPTPFHYSGY
jgi:hypothetical protein